MEESNITFASLGLSDAMLKALEKKGYGYPTTIQAEAIPYFLQWRDVIAKAPTGTGKTFAFGIPMIEHIDAESEEVQGLILAPTRELAIQIGDELRGLLTYFHNIRVAVLYGGAGIGGQIKALEKKPQIVVATPGRLMDHYNRKTIRLDKIQTVVLDEADRMLDMGFIHDVTRLLDRMDKRKNLGLFSATISREVMDIAWVYQRDAEEVTVREDEQNKPDIKQFRMDVSFDGKAEAIAKMHSREQPPYAGSPEDDRPGNAHPDREESADQKLLELFGQLDRKIQEQRLFLNPGLSREDLMRLINSSKNQIAQIIQVGAGTNLAGYLNGLRIEYAADLLVFHPHYKVTAIAREAGIPNLSSFHRLFKMRYGMTPAEFRKMRAA